MLPEHAIKLLAPFFPELDLKKIRVRAGIPWYVPMRADAYTNRHRIYFAPGKYDADSREGLALIAHELAHCAQYQTHGTWRFRLLYVSSWLAQLIQHRSFASAYLENRFEVDARVMAARVYDELSRRLG